MLLFTGVFAGYLSQGTDRRIQSGESDGAGFLMEVHRRVNRTTRRSSLRSEN
jgi:hypothetical protein